MAKPLKFLIVLAVLLTVTAPLHSQSCVELFSKAKELQERKNYNDAIIYYERAKACDHHLKKDCDKKIAECKTYIESDYLLLSQKEVMIPFQGSDSQININSNKDWLIENDSEWCKLELLENEGLLEFFFASGVGIACAVVICLEDNSFEFVEELNDSLNAVLVPRSALYVRETEHKIESKYVRAKLADVFVGVYDVASTLTHLCSVRS